MGERDDDKREREREGDGERWGDGEGGRAGGIGGVMRERDDERSLQDLDVLSGHFC